MRLTQQSVNVLYASTTFGLLLVYVFTPSTNGATPERPHIIFVLADDMGWNDVSFHGSDQIPTPNIDALAYNGIILNSHYVQSMCTPSRAALMTGKYPIHTGMQGYPILAAEPRGLPEGKILPQYLKELGYVTRAVGKWHLGFHRKELTPIYRGFDSHMGYWSGFVSYYDYVLQDSYPEGDYNGFDLRRNLTSAWDMVGRYATDVFTEEAVRLIQNHDVRQPLFLYLAHLAPHSGNRGKLLEAPQSIIDKFGYIADPNRRTYAAMVAKLDESVGRVVQALQRRNMLQNSIIVFLSDNGAPTIGVYPNWGSNYPHRGTKETLWEGGVKGLGLIWSPMLHQVPRVSHQLMHITDWLPTLYTAAGGDSGQLDGSLDGVDQWESLVYNLVSRREEVLLNIDEKTRNAALRLHNWKLVIVENTEKYFRSRPVENMALTAFTFHHLPHFTLVKSHKRSLRNGAYDSYYGASGLDPSIPAYNTTAVVHSLSGLAIAKALTSNFLRVTREEDVAHLRAAATVRCEPNTTFLAPPCNPAETGEACLYDVETDPCERNNLARTYDNVARHLRRLLVRRRSRLVPQSNLPVDAYAADPRKWNNTWTFWTDCTFAPDTNLCAATRDVKRVFGLVE